MSHDEITSFDGMGSPGEAVVTNLEDTVRVDEQVARLDITVDYFG
jgi:hypothetical protein